MDENQKAFPESFLFKIPFQGICNSLAEAEAEASRPRPRKSKFSASLPQNASRKWKEVKSKFLDDMFLNDKF